MSSLRVAAFGALVCLPLAVTGIGYCAWGLLFGTRR